VVNVGKSYGGPRELVDKVGGLSGGERDKSCHVKRVPRRKKVPGTYTGNCPKPDGVPRGKRGKQKKKKQIKLWEKVSCWEGGKRKEGRGGKGARGAFWGG